MPLHTVVSCSENGPGPVGVCVAAEIGWGAQPRQVGSIPSPDKGKQKTPSDNRWGERSCIVAESLVHSSQVCRCTASVLTQSRVNASNVRPVRFYSVVARTIPQPWVKCKRARSARTPRTLHHGPPFPFVVAPPVGFALTGPPTVPRRCPLGREFSPTDHTDSHQRRHWTFRSVCCHPAPHRAVERRCPSGLEGLPALCALCQSSLPNRYKATSRLQHTPGPDKRQTRPQGIFNSAG